MRTHTISCKENASEHSLQSLSQLLCYFGAKKLKRVGSTCPSVIAALRPGGSARCRRAYREPPFDLLYGFRGRGQNQELLSPYEMLRHWSMEPVLAPTRNVSHVRSEFTEAGHAYRKACVMHGTIPQYEAGKHYVATPAKNRILLPEIAALGILRHR